MKVTINCLSLTNYFGQERRDNISFGLLIVVVGHGKTFKNINLAGINIIHTPMAPSSATRRVALATRTRRTRAVGGERRFESELPNLAVLWRFENSQASAVRTPLPSPSPCAAHPLAIPLRISIYVCTFLYISIHF
jgi:hypothetical protein